MTRTLTDHGDDLVCPDCGFTHNHIKAVRLESGQEDRPEITSVEITMHCENGHVWVLLLKLYKGRVTIERTVSLDSPPFF